MYKACCGFGHREVFSNISGQLDIDNSNVVLVYFVRDYGGAFDAMKYALKKKKYVIKV